MTEGTEDGMVTFRLSFSSTFPRWTDERRRQCLEEVPERAAGCDFPGTLVFVQDIDVILR